MRIGRKIYYDVESGHVILHLGERVGGVKPTTIEQDIAIYVLLSERLRESFDCIELEYGDFAQDFAESNGFIVNVETKALEFSYPDPNEPEIEQPYQTPLSEQIASNMDYLLDVDFRLMKIEFGM